MFILYAKLGKTGFVFIVHCVYLSTCLFYKVKLWTLIFWKRWFSCLTAEFVLYTVLLVDLLSWLLYYIRTFCLISLAGHYLDSVACVRIVQRINLIVFNLYAFFNFWVFISGCLDLVFSITYHFVFITHNSKLMGPMAVWFVWIFFFSVFISITQFSDFWMMSYGNWKQLLGVFELWKQSYDGILLNTHIFERPTTCK